MLSSMNLNNNHKISLVIYAYDEYVNNVKVVLDSFGSLIDRVYLLCFDNNTIDYLLDYSSPKVACGRPITYVDISRYGYNINKCFNNLSKKHPNSIWILWRPYFIFNENKSDDFKELINKIKIGNYNMIYIYGMNLLIDVHFTNSTSMYMCRNGGCLIADKNVRLIEDSNLYIVNKNNNNIWYNIYDEENTEYYFFNFAKAYHNSYMLIDVFENAYLNFIRTNDTKFSNFSDWYEKKGQTVTCGRKYVENRLISSKENMVCHNINLTPALQVINLYNFDGVSRTRKIINNISINQPTVAIGPLSKKNKLDINPTDSASICSINNVNSITNNNNLNNDVNNITKYNDYSMTIITLVRNNNQYLPTSIGSLINQTSDKWNCIIINDGSFKSVTLDDFIDPTDLSKMMYKDRFKIINLDEWLGLVKCHKTALLHVTNDIVGILDADDELDKTAVHEVLNIYNKSQEDNIYVYTNFYYCDMNMKKLICGYSNHVRTCLLNDRCANAFRTFKLKHYYLTEGYDDDLQFGAEDQDIMFKLENVCTPVFLDIPLYFYRHDTNNITTITSLKNMSKWSLFLSILKNIKNRYDNNDFQLKIFSNKNPSELKKYYSYRTEKNQYSQSIKLVSTGYVTNLINAKNNEQDMDMTYHIELYSNNIYFMNILEPMFRLDMQILGDYINEYNSDTSKDTFDVIINWDPSESKFFINKYSNEQLKITDFVKIHPNMYFDHVYVINLKKDVIKRERIRKVFKSLNIKYEFFDAVYGNDEHYLRIFNENKYITTLKSVGAYGYTLSMINIFKDALEHRYKKIWVCDDDIVLHKDFLNLFDKHIRNIPFDWKVLFFGLSGPWTHPFINKGFQNFNYQTSHINDVFNCDGSYCVGYDILTLHDLMNTVSKFEKPFDTAMIRYLNMNPTINRYSFQPYLAIADTTKSDIAEREHIITKNFEAYQFKYRQNVGSFDLESMLGKPYKSIYRNPYPLVSIIIILHNIINTNKTLESIESIMDQTYKNIEVVLIDITSNITSNINNEIFNKYKKSKKVKIIHTPTEGRAGIFTSAQASLVKSELFTSEGSLWPKNTSYIEAKNMGIISASGEIVGFHGINDLAINTKVEKQIGLMVQKKLLMVSSNMIKFNDNNMNTNKFNILKCDMNKAYFDYSTMLIRKDLFDVYGLYTDHHEYSSNKEFYERVILNETATESNNIHQKIDEVLVITADLDKI